MRKLFIVMLAVVLVPAAAFAQQSGMRGEVRDNTGGILPGVPVEACSEALIEGCRVAITDGEGIYFITNLQAGLYTVTMSLPGWTTLVQEEIIVPAQFTQEVNGQLAIDGVEEIITVTGESRVVDTVSASRTEVFTRELFDALPTTRSTASIGYLAQGVRLRAPSVAGLGGESKIHSRGLTVHHTTTHLDGMQTDNADCDFCGGGKSLNPGYAAEFAMTTASSNAEVQTGGFRINLIPREGGYTQSGSAYVGWSGAHLSNTNIDDNLRNQGLITGDQVIYNEEINPSWGGPILRDRLWFFTSLRFTKRYTAVAGTIWPDSELMRENLPELIGRQGISEGWGRTVGLRLTGQVSERQKVSAFFQRSFSLTGRGLKGWDWENVTLEPLEGSRHRNPDNQRNYMAQLKYTYTPTSRTLFEFGYMTNNGGGALTNQPNVPITRRLGAGRDLAPPVPDDLIQCVVTPCFHPVSYDQTRPYFTDGTRRQDDVLRTRWAAQTSLATMYADGRGVAQDDDAAARWHGLAAEQGHAVAQASLGALYRDGLGVAQDDTEAVRLFLLAAEQGNPFAQFSLGGMYFDGRGVEQDDAEAVRWYRLAAEQGFPRAQASLGGMYAEGRGVPQDDAEAVRWYRLGAEQGDAVAQGDLGFMYAHGRGVVLSTL